EREMAAWQRTLTPDDIKRENAYRAAQRKAGKSRKGNIKDPNAPKKPLSAYFMFLQHIRADPERVKQVFGDEKETTAQSVLAAQTWRAMTDEDRKVSFIDYFLSFTVPPSQFVSSFSYLSTFTLPVLPPFVLPFRVGIAIGNFPVFSPVFA
ncbi:uncharacterized protein FOMMEDRAFT_90339, partial [Fomitiporia mediterranea MF3/22]|uniref:uncharacterized protein n=1 Tax=Fomitiporia mediterranea (strain MF3/22) TaxID=694068 RepID=UPI00044083EE